MTNLDLKQYANELHAIDTEMSVLKKRKTSLENDIIQYYAEDMAEAYSTKAEPFGKVTLSFNDVELCAITPKRVEWDQAKLAELYKRIGQHEDASQYIDVKYSVSETKYKSWPEDIKAAFLPARTIKPGAVKIEIDNLED